MSDKPILGTWTCERGGTADVRQTVKKGRHFYTQCGCCGLNQGTGAKRQQDIWDNATFVDGSTVVRPANVSETKAAVNDPTGLPESETKPQPISEPVGDFDPTEPEPGSETERSSPGFDRGKIFAGVALVLAAGAGIWMN